MARLSPSDAWSRWWDAGLVYHPDYRAGLKNINRKLGKYFHALQIYWGCQHVLWDFINSWGTNSFDNCNEIFVWHRSQAMTAWQCDKWPGHHRHPGTLTKNVFLQKYLISQQIVGTTIQYWVECTKVCYYGAWCWAPWAWPITIAAYLGPDPILMTVING